MRILLSCLLLTALLGIHPLQGQDYAITFDKLETLQQNKPRPIVVFLHAPWCKFCDNMKQTTFKDEAVKKQLTEDFYFVSFNGESKEDVTFLGNTFKYRPSGANTGIHELAEQLGSKDGTVTYPTLVFLNERYEILYQNDGFLTAKRLKAALAKVVETKN